MQIEYYGNKELLNLPKIAFLCSRTVSSGAILSCYDWATQIEENTVVIGGFQSKMEKDVFHFLLKRRQHIIIAIARKMYKELPLELMEPMNEERLLIISTSSKSIRVSNKTAYERNLYISQIADEIVFGYISKESSLNTIFQKFKEKSKVLIDKNM